MDSGQGTNYGPNVRIHEAPRRVGLKKGISKNIKRVIAVHSGKGGVGKTFVAVNLAAFLAKEGLKVGLLDADIDCPNVLKMLKPEGRLVANADKKIVPLEKFGIKIISMASILKNEDDVTLWRGPIVSRALQQFIHDTDWGDLDFLIVDLPPGTGDLPITALNILDRAELLVVSTPGELSVMDARKSLRLAHHMGTKILGIMANMAGGAFGDGAAVMELAKNETVTFLGSIPIKPDYSRIEPSGEPASLQDETIRQVFSKAFLPQ